MTLPSILTTARTLSYYTLKQEVLANNLANSGSDGYKVDRLSAQNLAGSSVPVGVQVLNLSQGAIRDTGRQLDLAIEGEGFMVIETPGGERLTRGGSLVIDAGGYLSDRNGNRLLGLEGPVRVAGRVIKVESDGTVVVDDARADRLRLVTAEAGSLQKEGEGRFRFGGEALQPGKATVLQGSLEDANVDPLLGTVEMIMVQRAYAANLQALRAVDGVMGILTGQIAGR